MSCFSVPSETRLIPSTQFVFERRRNFCGIIYKGSLVRLLGRSFFKGARLQYLDDPRLNPWILSTTGLQPLSEFYLPWKTYQTWELSETLGPNDRDSLPETIWHRLQNLDFSALNERVLFRNFSAQDLVSKEWVRLHQNDRLVFLAQEEQYAMYRVAIVWGPRGVRLVVSHDYMLVYATQPTGSTLTAEQKAQVEHLLHAYHDHYPTPPVVQAHSLRYATA